MKLLRKALVDGSFLLDLDERDISSIFRQVARFLVARGHRQCNTAGRVGRGPAST